MNAVDKLFHFFNSDPPARPVLARAWKPFQSETWPL